MWFSIAWLVDQRVGGFPVSAKGHWRDHHALPVNWQLRPLMISSLSESFRSWGWIFVEADIRVAQHKKTTPIEEGTPCSLREGWSEPSNLVVLGQSQGCPGFLLCQMFFVQRLFVNRACFFSPYILCTVLFLQFVCFCFGAFAGFCMTEHLQVFVWLYLHFSRWFQLHSWYLMVLSLANVGGTKSSRKLLSTYSP